MPNLEVQESDNISPADWQEMLAASCCDVKRMLPFNAGDRYSALDLTLANSDLTPELLADTEMFSAYIAGLRRERNVRYLIGGYNEDRAVYGRSAIFSGTADEEPRSVHLGIDIWGDAGTPVFAPLSGVVHSLAFNDHFGDYGATIILSHSFRGLSFHSLYGHLALGDIRALCIGQFIPGGKLFAHFGMESENGHWPPHLHFQLIRDIGDHSGDYPGVCRRSQREKYLVNSPDPSSLIRFE